MFCVIPAPVYTSVNSGGDPEEGIRNWNIRNVTKSNYCSRKFLLKVYRAWIPASAGMTPLRILRGDDVLIKQPAQIPVPPAFQTSLSHQEFVLKQLG